jgi:hypothetical protein
MSRVPPDPPGRPFADEGRAYVVAVADGAGGEPRPVRARFGATPMLLFGGVFYATDQLPTAVRLATRVTPLWHGTELCRSLSLGTATPAGSAGHVAYLAALAGGGAWLAARSIRRRVVG